MEKFRKLRQHIKNWIRFERRNYITTIASEIHTNSKRFWTFFSFKNKRKPIPEKDIHNNFTFSDDRARAEAFNAFFKSVFKDHSGCKVNLEEPTTLLTVPCVTLKSRLRKFQRYSARWTCIKLLARISCLH